MTIALPVPTIVTLPELDEPPFVSVCEPTTPLIGAFKAAPSRSVVAESTPCCACNKLAFACATCDADTVAVLLELLDLLADADDLLDDEEPLPEGVGFVIIWYRPDS